MLVSLLTWPLSAHSRRERRTAPDEIADAARRRPAANRCHPWTAFKRLTALGFPRRFPIVQFPNLPLIVAFVAGEAAVLVFARGTEHRFAAAAAYLAMTIWAYEELVRGVNWFRRLLGLTYLIILVVRVAHGLRA